MKFVLDGGMNLVDLYTCNHLNFHLQDGVVSQQHPRVTR